MYCLALNPAPSNTILYNKSAPCHTLNRLQCKASERFLSADQQVANYRVYLSIKSSSERNGNWPAAKFLWITINYSAKSEKIGISLSS